MVWYKLLISFILTVFLTLNSAYSSKPDKKNFNQFILEFSENKLSKKFDKTLIKSFVKNTKFIKRVIELDRSQPEFKLTLAEYLNKVVTKNRIKKAKRKYKENYKTLKDIEKHFNVQPRFIVALWGIETDFGRVTGFFPVVSSLATLVYDGRRGSYFEKELMHALNIIKGGHIKMENMKGSWAGAMGQCQFMPSSFVRYAIDWDKDKKKDIWTTKKDVFASASNYLKSVGWNHNQTWGRKVYFKNKKNVVKFKKWLELKKWSELGVLKDDKTDLPTVKIKARLIIPKNSKNSGYLVYNNFESILNWNRSNYFGIAVGTLSDHLLNKNLKVSSR